MHEEDILREVRGIAAILPRLFLFLRDKDAEVLGDICTVTFLFLHNRGVRNYLAFFVSYLRLMVVETDHEFGG